MGAQREKNRIRLALQIILPVLCLLWLAFIFSNSLRGQDASSAQSSAVVETVQDVAQVIAPNSFAATAKGEDYATLHHYVRKAAHFIEFAVLGALLCWCYFAYTSRRAFLWIPAIGVALVPVCDELLQKTVDGRAGTFSDMLLDMSGGAVGFALALLCVWVGWRIYTAKRVKNNTHVRDEMERE